MQVNDPDPQLWIAMYASLALANAAAAMGFAHRGVLWVIGVLALGWSLSLMPGVVELFTDHPAGHLLTGMSPDRPYVEEAREALGLAIGVLSIAYVLWLASRSSVGTAQDSQ